MSQLLLVRHAQPEIQPDVPSNRWALNGQGRQQAVHTAEQLRAYRPEIIITSEEPKAVETGEIIADALDLSCRSAPGLHEHDRTGVPFFDDIAEFEAAVKRFFENSAEQVFGGESADDTKQRFVGAVQEVLEAYPTQTVAIVAHGTVNTLFAQAFNPVSPFELWQTWPLAGYAVLSRPDFELSRSPDA